jgi:hypothetical protein
MKLNKFIVILLAANGVLAQHKTTAKIETVKENGLHKIALPPEIRSFSNEELGDFRIWDAKGTEVPYYFIPQERSTEIPLFFSECSILSKTVLPKNKTSLIFENPKTAIDSIVLCITNSDVTKPYRISGSNDQKEWFGLVNTARLDQLINKEETVVFKTINFPLTSYRYIKIEFDDKKTLPINVLKIGYFANKITFNTPVEIVPKNIKILQIPAEKKTQIYIVFDYPQIVNQISFEISQPNLFQRNARIGVNPKKAGNQKGAVFPETFTNFELNSNQKNSFSIPQLFEKNFFIEIDNRDNPALTVSKIRFFQHPVWVIADLKADEKYNITTGNPKLRSPEYDLEHFKNNIDSHLPEVKIYAIKHFNSRKTALKVTSIWQQPWFMWLCISLGGMVILYFTSRLVKDMKNNTPN